MSIAPNDKNMSKNQNLPGGSQLKHGRWSSDIV